MLTVDKIATPGTTERKMMLKIAVAYMRRLRERRAIYEAECAEDARRGYRPHYCIHGTNQWTDYDNICGPCEEGYTDEQIALEEAWRDMRDWITRMSLHQDFHEGARTAHAPVSSELASMLGEWSCEPLAILTHYPRPVRNLP
jgi:hypothetical protein